MQINSMGWVFMLIKQIMDITNSNSTWIYFKWIAEWIVPSLLCWCSLRWHPSSPEQRARHTHWDACTPVWKSLKTRALAPADKTQQFEGNSVSCFFGLVFTLSANAKKTSVNSVTFSEVLNRNCEQIKVEQSSKNKQFRFQFTSFFVSFWKETKITQGGANTWWGLVVTVWQRQYDVCVSGHTHFRGHGANKQVQDVLFFFKHNSGQTEKSNTTKLMNDISNRRTFHWSICWCFASLPW